MSRGSAVPRGVTPSRPFDGRRVLLGVSGGIASYKSVWLARLLTQAGANVDVILTRGAQEFVGAITFESVTGRRVFLELFGAGNALDHIRLAKDAEVVILAPATASLLARVSQGHADDLLTACLLATACPVLMVPAMNDRMWANVRTQRNVHQLREDGYVLLEPDTGPLAAGEGAGPGRMPEPEAIVSHAARLLEPDKSLAGRRLVVTAGATREPIDPVRFISNHSTGLMGTAIAAAAWRRGAEVTLIAGHTDVPDPVGPSVIRTTTTESMAKAVREALAPADALIMAAAPADFAPIESAPAKIAKRSMGGELKLSATTDILGSVALDKGNRVVVGFALETGQAVEKGSAKLEAKGLDLIVVNDQNEPGAGFGGNTNRVTIVGRDGAREELPIMLKTDVADVILDRVAALLDGR